MRRIILSTLFLSTVLAHAQAGTQGQSGTTLIASNNAVAASNDAAIPTHPRRVSTGVVYPKLISNPKVHVSAADFQTQDFADQHVVVGFRVDENGAPQNVHLVKSLHQTVDARVLEAVREYHFVPGTLDDQKIALDVNLIVNFDTK